MAPKPLLFCPANMIRETDPSKEPTSQQKYGLSSSVDTANSQGSKPESTLCKFLRNCPIKSQKYKEKN